jgi:hypothetical protein
LTDVISPFTQIYADDDVFSSEHVEEFLIKLPTYLMDNHTTSPHVIVTPLLNKNTSQQQLSSSASFNSSWRLSLETVDPFSAIPHICSPSSSSQVAY